MKKVAVIYWSQTGNTQQMAQLIAQGALEGGAQVKCWKKPNSIPSSPSWKAICKGVLWLSSARMAGVTESGCAPGRIGVPRPGPLSSAVRVWLSAALLLVRTKLAALLWAKPWPDCFFLIL